MNILVKIKMQQSSGDINRANVEVCTESSTYTESDILDLIMDKYIFGLKYIKINDKKVVLSENIETIEIEKIKNY